MSAQTIRWLDQRKIGTFRFEVVEPSAVKGIISPQRAAHPWTGCERGQGRLLSWELALGRLTVDVPCRVQAEEGCRRLVTNKLMYIERQEFFFTAGTPACCPDPDQRRAGTHTQSRGHSFGCWYTPAEPTPGLTSGGSCL